MSKCRFWAEGELKYITNQTNEGIHPKSFINEFNERFPPGRTLVAMCKKLRELNISTRNLDEHPVEHYDQSLEYERKIKDLSSKLYMTTKKYDRLVDGLNIRDQIIESGESIIKSLPHVKQPAFPKLTKKKIMEQAVLLFGDIHFGEVVRDDEMRGLNEYNVDISNRRIKHLINTVIDLSINKLQGYQFEKLNLFLLGDMVCGAIHEELSETSEGNVMDWTVNVAYLLAQATQNLLTVFPEIDIVGVVGNHGRLKPKVKFKERYVNWDFVVYQYLSLFLAEDIRAGKVGCYFPTSYWTTHKVHDWNWLILHGDNIRSWNQIPWYGIIRATHRLKEMLAVKNEQFQYMALGHFHNQGTLDMMQGRRIINGSVIGGNEYSMGAMFTTSEASQFLCGVHPDEGITWEYHINLQGREKNINDPFVMADLSKSSLGEIM